MATLAKWIKQREAIGGRFGKVTTSGRAGVGNGLLAEIRRGVVKRDQAAVGDLMKLLQKGADDETGRMCEVPRRACCGAEAESDVLGFSSRGDAVPDLR